MSENGISANVRDQAVAWAMRFDEGPLTERERASFDCWLRQPDCSAVYQRLQVVLQRFDFPASLGLDPVKLTEAVDHQSRTRRQVIGGLAIGVVGTSFAALTGLQHDRGGPDIVRYATTVGERRTLMLADRTRLTLNAASVVDVIFSSGRRTVLLRAGKLLVTVAKDPGQPFVVETQFGSVTALGTEFQVALNRRDTEVAVIESRVQLLTRTGTTALLRAGTTSRFNAAFIAPCKENPSGETGWTSGFYIAADADLAQLVENLRPYCRGRILLDPAVARLPVSGTFPLDAGAAAIDALPAVLPVRVRHGGSGAIAIGPA